MIINCCILTKSWLQIAHRSSWCFERELHCVCGILIIGRADRRSFGFRYKKLLYRYMIVYLRCTLGELVFRASRYLGHWEFLLMRSFKPTWNIKGMGEVFLHAWLLVSNPGRSVHTSGTAWVVAAQTNCWNDHAFISGSSQCSTKGMFLTVFRCRSRCEVRMAGEVWWLLLTNSSSEELYLHLYDMLSPLQFLIKFFSMSTLYGEGHTGGDVETNPLSNSISPLIKSASPSSCQVH